MNTNVEIDRELENEMHAAWSLGAFVRGLVAAFTIGALVSALVGALLVLLTRPVLVREVAPGRLPVEVDRHHFRDSYGLPYKPRGLF